MGTEKDTVTLVRDAAIGTDQDKRFVLVVDNESKVKVRPVGIGPAPEGQVEITTGLQEGERVITEGIQKVRPGMVVKPVPVPRWSLGW